MKFAPVLLALALGLGLANAADTDTVASSSKPEFNPPRALLHPDPALAARASLPNTNAERLARGLPLKKPRRASPTLQAKRQAPSGSPLTYKSAIRVIDTGNGNVALGYIGSTTNVFGEYGITPDAANALAVTPPVGSSGPSAIAIPGSFPFLGGVLGYGSTSPDFALGSYNYAYLGGVHAGSSNQTNSVSAATGYPTLGQSAIWTYDTGSGLLAAHWTNTDGSTPATQIVYYMPDNVIALTGDSSAFGDIFGDSSRITLQVVQIPTSL
ncbi:hypothetical protein PUNSTDRAFT_45047 [Punctularia strigosozonata HHB-11173 SS5]|uniref:uncharacterized protein n=1 Tax=Punctularia strigosozonata (strain HHB-11173) TaxID=741275 RepID=UPI0004417B45|nr:uncharacterized protein PUNSTDRAFT_45047 [Punctularia strigosozonata HHB-11173 SS5]EIN08582.1 hypothetical protein PUNSTDRAFT_45047 [Punctularia strigosozonata HHB-11173 SS5]